MSVPQKTIVPAVEVRDLAIGYGDRVVLENLNFAISPGEIVCIMGGSGCGKSTLLKHIIGLYQPLKGDILIRGESMVYTTAERKKALMRSLGVTYQGGALFGWMSVAENVEFWVNNPVEPEALREGFLRLAAPQKAEVQDIVNSIAGKKVHLPHKLNIRCRLLPHTKLLHGIRKVM